MKEQELQLEKIIDTINLVYNKNSAVFHEYSRIDKSKDNPLSSLMVDNLNLLSQELLYKKMPELCDILHKTESEQLINWLVEQPAFKKWLNPIDKVFFDNFQNISKRQEIFKSNFFECENNKNNKNKSFILDRFFDSPMGLDYTYLAENEFNQDFWIKIIEKMDEESQKKFVIKMIEEINGAEKSKSLNNIFTVFMIAMDKNILSQKEANILFTSQLVNQPDSLLMPQIKVDKINYAINIQVHLDFQFLDKYHKEPHIFEKSILARSSSVFERVAKSNPDFDIKYWYDKERLIQTLEKNSLDSYNKENVADRILYNLQETHEKVITLEKKKMLDDVMTKFPNQPTNNDEENETTNSQHFRI